MLLVARGAAADTVVPTGTRSTSAPGIVRRGDDALIRGRVVDVHGQPIRGATVSVDTPSGPRTVATDERGRYAITGAPIGSDIVVLCDGYAAGLAIAAGDTDDIVLSAEASETIAVSGTPPPPTQGAGQLARADLERLPGAGNDVIRALDAMPGVVSFPLPLADSGVAIRGSSPQDSKILVDGFDVPELYHDIGFRSIIPAEAIDKIDYLPGGFDVEFGRATSGIVELTTRAGSERPEQQAEVSSSDASVIAQGGLPHGSYLIAFRRSVIDQLLPALLPANLDLALTTVPRYYDEQLRIDYSPSSKWSLRLSSLGSDDVLGLYTSQTEAPDKRLYDRTRFLRVTTTAVYHDGAWTANLALSGIAQQTLYERGTLQHLSVTSPGVTARAELSRVIGSAAGVTDLTWRLGGELAASRSTIDLALPVEQREGQPATTDDPMDTSQRFIGSIWTPDAAAWTSAAASLDPRIRLTVGLRLDAFERIHEAALQPRAELAITLSPTVTARLSAGAYRRPPEYQTELLDAALGSEHATQLISGLTIAPSNALRIQTSLYYTDRSHLITQNVPGAAVADPAMGTTALGASLLAAGLSNSGHGTTYGAELLATLHQGPWFGWLSYAYSHSTRIDEPGGPSRLFDYDQPHSLNAAISYRFGRWQLGGRFRLYSGLPYTPVLGAVFNSDTNLYTPIYGPVNSERAPLHHELDLRLDRQWSWGRVKMTYFLDVQNVYMNDSAVGYIYSFDYQQRSAFRSLPILPSAGLRGEL